MPFFLNQKNITKRKKQKSKKTLLFEQVWALPDPPSHLSNNIKQIKLNFLSKFYQIIFIFYFLSLNSPKNYNLK